MAKPEKSTKSNFVIKLSSETVQKLSEEQVEDKNKTSKILTDTDSGDSCNNSKSKDNSRQPLDTEEEQNKIEVSSNDIENSDSKKSNDPSDSNNSDEAKDENLSDSDSINASWGDYAPYITYEGDEAIYTDPSTHQKYTWSETTKSWSLKEGQTEVAGRVYSYEDDTHIYTDTDGSKSFWDAEKKAWLPKVDDDFLAFYQMSYGFVDNNSKDDEKESKDKESPKTSEPSGVKRKSEPQWFEQADEKNTKVYVSNLPLDITEEEFVNLMQKCGLVERDVITHKMKIKMYMDKEHNCFKGDALCTYIKIESVDLALKLLDGSDYKGNKIKVERAQFQMKGDYNPALKPKKKKKKELEKIKKMQQKLFDWRPEKFIGERSKHERVVIIKNVFHPSDFDKEVQLILDYQQDLREECVKCGEVRKVLIYDRHPEGVAQVTMKEPEQADAVVQLINGRWFGKRQLTAEIWDGKTKYKIAETDADINKRIDKWDKFLEEKESEENKKTSESKPSEVEGKVSEENKATSESKPSEVGEKVSEENKATSESKPSEVGEKVSEENKATSESKPSEVGEKVSEENKATSKSKPSELSVTSEVCKQTEDNTDKSEAKLDTTNTENIKMEETVINN